MYALVCCYMTTNYPLMVIIVAMLVTTIIILYGLPIQLFTCITWQNFYDYPILAFRIHDSCNFNYKNKTFVCVN